MCGRRNALGILCVALAGCAAAPDYRVPADDVPARWGGAPESGASAELAGSPWWKTFNDPMLDSLIGHALRANPDLGSAGMRIREARARGVSIAASQSPLIDARASFARGSESSNAPNPLLVQPDGRVESPSRPENLFQTGFDAKWEIDLFGGNRRTIEAAQFDFESAVYDRDAVLLTLLAEVSRNYIELRGAQERSRLASASLSAQRDSLTLIRARYEAGMTTDRELALAEAQVQRNAMQIPALDMVSGKATYRLALLTGQPLGAVVGELALSRSTLVPPVQTPVGLPSDLLRQRPDIRGAERRLAAASARLGAATADLYPRFSLFGTVGLASLAAGDFFNGASQLWSIGPSMTWPIFQGGRVKATIEIRDAQQQQALIAYRLAILNGIEDVENAITGHRAMLTRRAALSSAVDSEQRAVNFAVDRYRSGLADFRDVLDAQRSLFQTQSELSLHDTAIAIEVVALYKALGGGWRVTAPGDAELMRPPGHEGESK